MNKIVLIGRLTKDPELRYTQSGKAVASLSIAVNRRFKQDNQPEADFINCVAWGSTAEALEKYTEKGSRVGVSGRIQTRSYEANDGSKRHVTEVVVEEADFIDFKKQHESNNNNQEQQDFHQIENDDDLPF